MGGSYFDSAFRLVWTVIALVAFCFIAFFAHTTYRFDKGLKECRTADDLDVPLVADGADGEPLGTERFNLSDYWKIYYYAYIAACVFTIIQIVVATVAY